MKADLKIASYNNETGKRTEYLELFFYKGSLIIHRHGFEENTKLNRDFFPTHRVFWNIVYFTQVIVLFPNEIRELIKLFGYKQFSHLVKPWFRSNILTRLLWKIIFFLLFKKSFMSKNK